MKAFEITHAGVKACSVDELRRFLTAKTGLTHLVGHFLRPGVESLFATIEFCLFPPENKENHLFRSRVVEWNEFPYFVVSIPDNYLEAVVYIAETLFMSLRRGGPVLFGQHRPHVAATERSFFPGALLPNGDLNRAMYTVENSHESPLHMSRMLPAAIRDNESRVRMIYQSGGRPSPSEVAALVYRQWASRSDHTRGT